MLQRIEPSDSQLAGLPSGIDPAMASTEIAAGSVLHLPFGDVAADFRATGIDAKARNATYELLVSNETSAPLATFAYAVETPGSRSQITWNAIVVPPHSAIAVEIDVKIPRRRRMPRVVAELFADEAQLTLDASPPERSGRRITSQVAAVASACFLLALGAGAYAASRPHVLALAAPDTVRAGAPFSVAYALADAPGGQYVVETPDGLQVSRGELTSASGAFTVTLPKSELSSGYDVRVFARGRFGTNERTTHVLASPSRIDPPRHPRAVARAVRLGSLSLDRDIVHGGESIVVGYHATEDPGMVRLIDSLGTVRAEALLTHRGQSILVAPRVDADQDFRIVATVERGTGHDEVTTPVTILRATTPVPAPSGVVAGSSPLAAQGSPTDVVAAKTVAPIAVDRVQTRGRNIVVRIDQYKKNLHVALMGASSDEVVGVDVDPGQSSVVLTPPIELATTRYEIVATYATGLGQETLIRPITFRAP